VLRRAQKKIALKSQSVVHTHVEMTENDAVLIRIISARRATRKEAAQYRQGGST